MTSSENNFFPLRAFLCQKRSITSSHMRSSESPHTSHGHWEGYNVRKLVCIFITTLLCHYKTSTTNQHSHMFFGPIPWPILFPPSLWTSNAHAPWALPHLGQSFPYHGNQFPASPEPAVACRIASRAERGMPRNAQKVAYIATYRLQLPDVWVGFFHRLQEPHPLGEGERGRRGE